MYTPSQAATLFRVIRKSLLSKPEEFKKEGIFRVSGDRKNAKAMIEQILKPKALPYAPMPIYDAITALKIMLDEKNSCILDPKNSRIKALNEMIEMLKPAQCVLALNQFIDELSLSADVDEHFAGEVLYTLVQLAKEAVKHQKENRMNPENLGIILGPNFEKLINNDPQKMLMLTDKLNIIAKLMLEDDTYLEDFEQKYASRIIHARQNQIIEYQAMKKLLATQKEIFEGKISQYQAVVAKEKRLVKTAKRRDKKLLQLQIKDDELALGSFMRVASDDALMQAADLDEQIKKCESEIAELKQKYPSQLDIQWQRIAALTEEIHGFITDSSEEDLKPRAGLTRSLSLLGPTQMEMDQDEDYEIDELGILRKSGNPLMTPVTKPKL